MTAPTRLTTENALIKAGECYISILKKWILHVNFVNSLIKNLNFQHLLRLAGAGQDVVPQAGFRVDAFSPGDGHGDGQGLSEELKIDFYKLGWFEPRCGIIQSAKLARSMEGLAESA